MQTLWKNTRAYQSLWSDAEKNQLGHAYLLLSADVRNLRACLKCFAKPFFTAHAPSAPSAVRAGERIDTESFSDCLFFPESDKRFSVEDAEKISQECALKPVEGDKKLFVIGDFSQATTPAQNKLLKLLEEPPEGVYFLLGATSAFAVLPTVLSRVKKLEIPALDAGLIQGALSRVYGTRFSENEYAVCAVACGGVLGEAQEMLEGGVYKALIEDAFALVQGNAGSLPALVKRIGETKRKKQLLSLLRLIYRDATVQKKGFGGENAIFLRGEKARIQRVADAYALPALLRAQAYITDAEKQLYFNAVFPQCLEILMAKIYENNV